MADAKNRFVEIACEICNVPSPEEIRFEEFNKILAKQVDSQPEEEGAILIIGHIMYSDIYNDPESFYE